MAAGCLEPAALSQEQVDRIEGLATDLGVCVMALDPGCKWADLDQTQLDRLKALEGDLGLILLAYNQR